MKFKMLGVVAILTVASVGTAGAQVAKQTKEIIGCTENTCVVRICTYVAGASHCSIGLEPRGPQWGPGYPEEP